MQKYATKSSSCRWLLSDSEMELYDQETITMDTSGQ